MGTVVAYVSWEGGVCVTSEPFRFQVRGHVEGGGEHLVAGCPVGETVRTDADGRFRTTAVEEQPCVLRVVDVDGSLSMGQKFPVAADEDVEVVLQAAEPLPAKQVAMAEQILGRMVEGRLEKAHLEVKRWSEAPQDDPWVAWMKAQAEAEVAFFTAEQEGLDDPVTRREAVAELLLGTNN